MADILFPCLDHIGRTIILLALSVSFCLTDFIFCANLDFARGDFRNTSVTVQPSAPPDGVSLTLANQQTTFLIDETFACEYDPFAIIFVYSAPDHIPQRNSIRSTWGAVVADSRMNTKLLFLVGSTSNMTIMSQLSKESALNHDILQISAIDTYANLTLKSVAMLRWINASCSRVRYVIKTDDDTFLNSFLLVKDLSHVVHSEFMMGDIIAGARPIRDKSSKYFTSTNEYSDAMYPTYLSGAAYVISGDLIPTLCEAARSTELFWLEDVFVTGILARRVRAKHVFNAKFGIRLHSLASCQMKRTIALHRISSEEMYNAWKLLASENERC